MSRPERIGRMRILLSSPGGLKTREVMEHFEVSRSTVLRDIQYLRDRLKYEIYFDPQRNSYYVSHDNTSLPEVELPGLMLTDKEAYAFLTLINLSKNLHPGIVQRYTSVVRSVLKSSLRAREFMMKRLDEKFCVEMPGIDEYDSSAAHTLGEALIDDLIVKVEIKAKGEKVKCKCYVRLATLRPDGWYMTIEDAVGRNKGRQRSYPLNAFVDCVIQGRTSSSSRQRTSSERIATSTRMLG
jgi:hypothetical protein